MIKVGVPKDAVLHKMKSDGINPKEISSKNEINDRKLITPDMLKSISLKKGKQINFTLNLENFKS